jgi:DNA-binding MarR family transcriptional regulator
MIDDQRAKGLNRPAGPKRLGRDNLARPRLANLMGALTTTLAEELRRSQETASGMPASGPAALTTLFTYQGHRIVMVGQLAAILELSHSATVRLVDRLVEARLAERGKGEDAREVAVSLTMAGSEAARQILREREAVLAEALDPLTEDEVVQIGATLAKVLGAMTSGRRRARWMCRTCDHGLCHRSGGCPVDEAAAAMEQ